MRLLTEPGTAIAFAGERQVQGSACKLGLPITNGLDVKDDKFSNFSFLPWQRQS